MLCAFSFAMDKAGNNMEARIAIIAITTRSSIKVKPRGGRTSGRASSTHCGLVWRLSMYLVFIYSFGWQTQSIFAQVQQDRRQMSSINKLRADVNVSGQGKRRVNDNRF